MSTSLPVVYLSSHHDFHCDLFKKVAGEAAAATGETVAGCFSADEVEVGDDALDVTALDDTSTPMPEIGSTGGYLGTLSHANKVAALGEYVGGSVWEVITVGGIVTLATEVQVRKARSA